jgi:hypothetical protein
MNNDTIRLSEPMTAALVIWLVGHDHKDTNAMLELRTLVQCLYELGILRGSPKLTWRAIRRTETPACFPAREVTRWTLIVLMVCKPSKHWLDSAGAWIEANRELLIEKRALLPDAPSFHDMLNQNESPIRNI